MSSFTPVTATLVIPPSVTEGEAAEPVAATITGDDAVAYTKSSEQFHLTTPSKSSLKRSGLTNDRVEIVASLDFKPLTATGGNDTLAGRLYDRRLVKRNSELELLLETMSSLDLNFPSQLLDAQKQYDSTLTATEADFALLKSIVALKQYAQLSTKFLDFLEEYEPDESLPVFSSMLESQAGTDTLLTILTNINFSQFSTWSHQSATILMGHLLGTFNQNALGPPNNFLNTGITGGDPVEVLADKILIHAPLNYSNLLTEPLNSICSMARDLNFSAQITKIRDSGEFDEDFKELIESRFGSSFITSPVSNENKHGLGIVSEFSGIVSFENKLVTGLASPAAYRPVVQLLSETGNGVFRTIKKDDGLLLPESNDIILGGRPYRDNSELIDDAFSDPSKILDFSNYEDTSAELSKSCKDLADFAKIGFGLLDQKLEVSKQNTDAAITADQNIYSPQGLAGSALEIFHRRFASTAWTSLSTEFYNWMTPEHISYTRNFGWDMIRTNPELAKEIVSAFVEDVMEGFLTVREIPEEIEGTGQQDEFGRDVEGSGAFAELTHILPETDNVVNLVGRRTNLNTAMGSVASYYKNMTQHESNPYIMAMNGNSAIDQPRIRPNEQLHNYVDSSEYGGNTYATPFTSVAEEGETDLSGGDLRNVNCMWADVYGIALNQMAALATGYTTSGTSGTSSQGHSISSKVSFYYGLKIVCAEIIDAVLEVLRTMVSAVEEVTPVADGDTVFPEIPGVKGPYGNGTGSVPWNYMGEGYDQFQMDTWVPTVLAWNRLFTRETDKTTFYRNRKIADFTGQIVDLFGYFMLEYTGFTARAVQLPPPADPESPNIVAVETAIGITPYCVTMKGLKSNLQRVVSPPSYTATSEEMAPLHNATTDPRVNTYYDLTVPGVIKSMLDDSFPLSQAAAGGAYSSAAGGEIVRNRYFGILQQSYNCDQVLAFITDMFDKYADRIEGLKETFLDTLQGEDSEVSEFVTNLVNSGDSGIDILQNLNMQQLSLKQVSLNEELGDPDFAYIPKLSVISSAEQNALSALCSEYKLKSPEADNMKVLFVGIPAGTLEKHNLIGSSFGYYNVRASYVDTEYPQIVFKTKNYGFLDNAFILPSDLDESSGGNLTAILNSMSMSLVGFEMQSGDSSSRIYLAEDDRKFSPGSFTSTDPSRLKASRNLLVSELLKIYYRVLVGINMSETSFPTTPEGLEIPISDNAVTLAEALAEDLDQISQFSESITSNISDMLKDVTTFSNPDDFVSGEIKPVDSSLLNDLSNAFQTRLFSPEVMRNRVLSAKAFDRVFAILVDPDEFEIIAPGKAEIGDAETPSEIFDYYLNNGIIQEQKGPVTGTSTGETIYKLASRKTQDGSLSIGNVTFTLGYASDEVPTEEMI